MKISIEQLAERIQSHEKWDVEIARDDKNKIIIWHDVYWGADNEQDYKRQERLIERQKRSNKLFEAWCWFDISGYDYWMVQQREQNYVSIDVIVNRDKVTVKQADYIVETLERFDIALRGGLNQYQA